ncbi:MAG: YchF/TatD family DNA exonuclease [Burkholderiaceae bacterium]|nr:YchF/TatD family DNA exonuclease [Burkholderiaceae bacterium]
MSVEFIDSHCHLNYPGLVEDTAGVLARMRAAGVVRALNICTTLEEAASVIRLAQQHEFLFASVGVHPDNLGVQEPTVDDLVKLAQDPKVVAIGETGLDYYRREGDGKEGDFEWQRERFRTHIRAAKKLKKPLIIHTREAAADTLRILREEGAEEVGGVMHCFTESVEVARAAIEMNFLISLSGIVTFKNAKQVHAVACEIPLEHLMIETDAPFLAPAPHRGKVNEPSYVVFVAQRIAELKSVPVAQVAQATSANFRRFASASLTPVKKAFVAHAISALFAVCMLAAHATFAPPAVARDALQAFGLAVRANDTWFINRMPQLGLDTRTRDDLRNNLLMIAIRDDGEPFALALLRQRRWQAKEVLDTENQLGETALMLAALKGSEMAVERLITLGADVNRAGWSALHYAATSGHAGIIRLLVEKSAFVDAASPNGTTPLMMAARFNHRHAVEALIELGADPTLTNQEGLTARGYADGNNNGNLAFWLQIQEISFANKYLRNLPDVSPDATLDDIVIQSGGEVVTAAPSASGRKGDTPVDVPAGSGVEVFKGIE